MTAASLDVNGLSAGYGRTRVLDAVSFSAGAGETLAILGRNGVGKTTLLASLMGLTTLQAGTVTLAATEISTKSATDRAWLGLGYVPQTRDIFQSLTVEQNLRVGVKDRPRSAISEAYALFPRLGERRRLLGNQLSGGEQQMLSVARTLLGKPSVLLLDEPLEGLAPVICDELMATLHALARDGTLTILLVEQQIERALDFAPRSIILDRGRIVWEGASRELKARRELVEKYLGVGVH
jgi:branched-chain amino acid transport system ATP-binding protein